MPPSVTATVGDLLDGPDDYRAHPPAGPGRLRRRGPGHRPGALLAVPAPARRGPRRAGRGRDRLDGRVTLTSTERGADYNLYVHVVDRASIVGDLRAAPVPGTFPIRYGLVRDPGTDACPVPQYVTRATIDPVRVAQRSHLD